MPKKFLDCVKNNGKVITKSVNEDQYVRICYPKGGGPSVSGEVKTKIKAQKRNMIKETISK